MGPCLVQRILTSFNLNSELLAKVLGAVVCNIGSHVLEDFSRLSFRDARRSGSVFVRTGRHKGHEPDAHEDDEPLSPWLARTSGSLNRFIGLSAPATTTPQVKPLIPVTRRPDGSCTTRPSPSKEFTGSPTVASPQEDDVCEQHDYGCPSCPTVRIEL